MNLTIQELTTAHQDVLDDLKQFIQYAEDYELDSDQQEVFFVDGIGHEISDTRISVADIL